MTSLRVFFLGNGWLGWQALKWLTSQQDVSIAGVAIHPPGRRKHGDDIRGVASQASSRVFDASCLRDSEVLGRIEDLNAAIAVSVLCGYILKSPFLDLFPSGCVNLHTSLLPYNRGAHPNVWSLVEGTPAGVSLHRIDSGIDTGAILAQRRVDVEPVDTALSLYRKLEGAGFDLFRDSWDDLVAGRIDAAPQSMETGTSHRVKDLAGLDLIDLDSPTTARQVINQLRSRTFPPHPSAHFVESGRKVYVTVNLEYAGEVKE